MPQFGKRTVLTRAHFAEFEAAFGDDPLGSAKSLAQRKDTGESGRFRRFTRDWIAERGDSLDIAWLKDESEGTTDELPEPAALAQEAMDELEGGVGGTARDSGGAGRGGGGVMPDTRLPSSWEECRLGDVVDYGATQKAEPRRDTCRCLGA